MGSKSRGGWSMGWCPKTNCKHHGDKTTCDKCFKNDLFEENPPEEKQNPA